jgi:hypothetical protein
LVNNYFQIIWQHVGVGIASLADILATGFVLRQVI